MKTFKGTVEAMLETFVKRFLFLAVLSMATLSVCTHAFAASSPPLHENHLFFAESHASVPEERVYLTAPTFDCSDQGASCILASFTQALVSLSHTTLYSGFPMLLAIAFLAGLTRRDGNLEKEIRTMFEQDVHRFLIHLQRNLLNSFIFRDLYSLAFSQGILHPKRHNV